MENEILKLAKGFFLEHKSIVIGTIFFGVLCTTIESIIIPNVVSATFNSLQSEDPLKNPVFKKKLGMIILSWICIKLSYAILNYFRKKVEPAITQYITVELIKSVFKKYEIENEFTNVSVVISKVSIIKKNLQDLFYIYTSIFIPRIIVILFSCINFYLIDKELALLIFCCLFIQANIVIRGLTKCIIVTFDEQENKDETYEYIEDIFYNMTTLQSISNAFDKEIDEIKKITTISKEKEEESYECINKKQYEGYITNIVIFCIIIYKVYSMYISNRLPKEKITRSVLALTGLFENIYEMTYYIPELTNKIGVLKNNEQFLKDLKLKEEEIINNKKLELTNHEIEFDNVSFEYLDEYNKNNYLILNKYSEKFPDKKIICLFGPSGSGKSTFIKLIFGILKPLSGRILIDKKNISEFSLLEIRKHICYISQNTTTLFNRTVIENIIYGFYTKEEFVKNKTVVYDLIKSIFDRFEFYDIFKNLDENKEKWSFLDQSVGKNGSNLSGGQKQLLHLLRIELNNNCKIVILDEPTSALDESSRNNVLNFIKYLNNKQKTIFIITHDKFYKDICYIKLQFFLEKNPTLIL